VRDLYEILGVPHGASEDDIKRAYRRRAREHHPDAGGDDEQFKELTAAYEVLRNPQTRANYDRYGDPRGPAGLGGEGFGGFGDLSDLIETFFGGFGGSTRASRPASRAGQDALVGITVSLEEAAAGVRREVAVTALRPCDACAGSGAADGAGPVRCSTCGGAGAVQQVRNSVFGQMLTRTTCPTCAGTGQQIQHPCPTCRGQGRREGAETVSVNVPPGVDDGTRLRLSGYGGAGLRGAPTGDLYVRIHVQPHEIFTREGNDLHCELRISMAQAALGAEIMLPTLDGKEPLRIPPGTQSGAVLTLRRQGMPKLNGGGARGNLHVHCRVETPTRLSPQEEQLLREFAELRGEALSDGTVEHRGLLGRLRDAFGT
jgi:molecular chaperone DnaJ